MGINFCSEAKPNVRFADQITALGISEGCGEHFCRASSGAIHKDGYRAFPNDFNWVGRRKPVQKTVCPLSVVKIAAGDEQARDGDCFRYRSTAAFTYIQNDLGHTLLTGFLKTCVYFFRTAPRQS